MATYQESAIYGDSGPSGMMTAMMANPGSASGDFDWNAVLANGIRGATQGAIAGMVNNAYASGQLQNPVQYQQQVAANQSSQLMKLAMIGGVAYLLMKG